MARDYEAMYRELCEQVFAELEWTKQLKDVPSKTYKDGLTDAYDSIKSKINYLDKMDTAYVIDNNDEEWIE